MLGAMGPAALPPWPAWKHQTLWGAAGHGDVIDVQGADFPPKATFPKSMNIDAHGSMFNRMLYLLD
jgi:hypothetical protein